MKRPSLALLLFALVACQPNKPRPLVSRAEFGVFFGGQVQERAEIPFQLDRSKLSFGFRIEFSEPLVREVKLAWELERPAPGKTSAVQRQAPARIVQLGESKARVGLPSFDQPLAFQPGDALGTWKIKVSADDQVVIDRSFVVYDAALRARAREAEGGL